jgi:tRNA-modifying protein YgfZ
MNIEHYEKIRNGSAVGFYRQNRGLIEVSGGEAVQFLDGLITNDMKTLEDGNEMRAAFPNAKGRLLAVVGVLRRGDKFLFETEAATYQKVFENLFRFTYAGDFFVEDLTENFVGYRFFGDSEIPEFEGLLVIDENYFVPSDKAEIFERTLSEKGFIEIGDELYETLRIEAGIPQYGVDMDEETVVPETGLPEMISYNKGCYIGQEVIARIHFRGKVAKELKGLVFTDENPSINPKDEIKSADDKNAGFITSVTFSPKLGKHITLAYVRNAYAGEGTNLKVGDAEGSVVNLPFLK